MASIEIKTPTPKEPKLPLLIKVIATAMSLFQLFTGIYQLTAMNQRVIHVTFGLVLIFLLYGWNSRRKTSISWDGYCLAGLTLGLGLYVLCTWFTKVGHMGMAPPVYDIGPSASFFWLFARRGPGARWAGCFPS